MPTNLLLRSLALAGVLSLPAFGLADTPAALHNWPQWRGPLANGVAPEATPPVTWSETRNVKWKFAIPGFGTSTPIVWENQVFILTAVPAETAEPPRLSRGGGPPGGGDALGKTHRGLRLHGHRHGPPGRPAVVGTRRPRGSAA
jgi:hypothetical protein